MAALTGLVITFNEEKHIHACLSALQEVTTEIIVVDSFSTDSTEVICRSFPSVRFFQQEWLGFGPQRNFGAARAANDYLLVVDADEILSPELIHTIQEQGAKGWTAAYSLQRLNSYYGKFIRHGAEFPDHKIRIYPKQGASWNSSLVHEQLELKATLPKLLLSGHLLHYTYDSLEAHASKQNKYTSLAAADLLSRGKRPSLVKILFSPLFTFVKSYFLKKGFLDGKHGLILALMHTNGTFLKYAKHWQLYYFPASKTIAHVPNR